jgi:hypothetical protein
MNGSAAFPLPALPLAAFPLAALKMRLTLAARRRRSTCSCGR